MSLVATVDTFEAWAATQVQVLQAILDDPTNDHGVQDLLPEGILHVARVVGLVGQLSVKPGGPWRKNFQGRMKGGQAAAPHIWLYHLGSGAQAQLLPPTTNKEQIYSTVRRIESMVNVT